MKLLHTIVDGETVVVDLTTGTILGTNLMVAPWPESQEEQEILLADAGYAAFYAQQNGVALLTANDTFGQKKQPKTTSCTGLLSAKCCQCMATRFLSSGSFVLALSAQKIEKKTSRSSGPTVSGL